MTKTIPLGEGTNLSVDDTTSKDGMPVAYYNCYRDNADALRSIPGCELYLDLNTGGNVYGWYSKLHSTLVLVAMGRIFLLANDGGTPVEISGSSLEIGTMPTFAEDKDSIFVAANSQVHKITDISLVIIGNSPTNVTSMLFTTGFLLCNGGELAGDGNFSDDGPGNVGARTGLYEDWEVYNNEALPDPLQALILFQNIYIYNFGTQGFEVSYVGNDPTNPFEVNKGRQSNLGLLAQKSVIYDGEAIYFLTEIAGARKVIKMPGGDTPQVISFGVDIPIENFERVDDAEAFTMAFRGQNFYVINFPSANTVIDEQYFEGVTLAWHVQKNCWRVFGKWNDQRSGYEMYRAASFFFVEAWGKKLIGGRDGKIYKLLDNTSGSYTTEAKFHHRWRDDNKKQWQLPRTTSLGYKGEFRRVPDQTRCGTYRNRQHELYFTNLSDAGEIFRMAVKSGQISYGTGKKKRSSLYRYDVKTGNGELIVNGVEEEVEALVS